MKIAITAFLFTKWDVYVYSRHGTNVGTIGKIELKLKKKT